MNVVWSIYRTQTYIKLTLTCTHRILLVKQFVIGTTLLLEKPCVYCINSNFRVPALQKKGRLSSTFVKWLVQVVWAHSCPFFLAINVSNSAQIRGLNIRTDQCNTSSNNSRSFLYWHDTLTALYTLFCTHRWR